ncbi:MAG: DUF2231 domain-containing protein [Bacteroidia bacterium]
MIPNFLKEFSNLHPLVVHFPIVLLLLAVLVQLAVLFFPKNNQLKWLTFLLLASGCIAALVAIYTAVHISGDADDKAIEIFETHQFFGKLTFWFSFAATILRFITLKWFKKKLLEIFVSAVIITTAVLVTITAHRGAQLVHIYDVGPKGNDVMSI